VRNALLLEILKEGEEHEEEDDCLLGYCAVFSLRDLPTFRWRLLPASSGRSSLHGATLQKAFSYHSRENLKSQSKKNAEQNFYQLLLHQTDIPYFVFVFCKY
jgi:hypothetical protein